MFVEDVPEEAVGVRESLRASALPDADHPVLLRMQHAPLKHNHTQFSLAPHAGVLRLAWRSYLLAHGLGVGDGGAEEAVPLQPAVQPGPVVVSVAGVRQAPGDQGVELPVCRVARLPCGST